MPKPYPKEFRDDVVIDLAVGALAELGDLGFVNVGTNEAPDMEHVCEFTPIHFPGDFSAGAAAAQRNETTQHIREALGAQRVDLGTGTDLFDFDIGARSNPAWTVLQRANLPEFARSKEWRLRHAPCKNSSGFTCDEFPYNSSYQGGPTDQTNLVARASLKLVPLTETGAQGGDIGGFYTACRVPSRDDSGVDPDDAWFIVIPQPISGESPATPNRLSPFAQTKRACVPEI